MLSYSLMQDIDIYYFAINIILLQVYIYKICAYYIKFTLNSYISLMIFYIKLFIMFSVYMHVIVVNFLYFLSFSHSFCYFSLSKSSIRSCYFHRLHRLAAGLSIFCVLSYCVFCFFCFVFVMLLSLLLRL